MHTQIFDAMIFIRRLLLEDFANLHAQIDTHRRASLNCKLIVHVKDLMRPENV